MLFRDEVTVLGNAQVELPEMAANGITAPKVPALIPITFNGLAAATASQPVFVAPSSPNLNGQYRLQWVSVTFGTTSTSGTLQIEKATGTQAIAAGTNLLQAPLSLSGTANTPVHSSGSSALVTNPNTVTLSAGDRLNIIVGGTMTGLATGQVTLWLARV